MMRPALVVLGLNLLACSIETKQGEVGIYQAPADGGDAGTMPPAQYFLTMIIRDFKRHDPTDPTTNPAFISDGNSEANVVAAELGTDGKPVYRVPSNAVPTYGPESFYQWYHDTPGTNVTLAYPLPVALTADSEHEYDSQKSGTPDIYLGVQRRLFLPIDDGSPYATAFGNQGDLHNYGFTGEVHATFALEAPGGLIQVRSDDDLYLFLDGQLAIDLGSKHVPLSAELELDARGVSVGEQHRLDLFYADRGGANADFLLKTNFALRDTID
jgi:fibro-slime domain-containing protein